MYQEDVCWEGKCQKFFFLKEDIGHFLMGMAIVCFICYWHHLLGNGTLDFIINVVLGLVAFYEIVGQLLIRYYYVKNVYYCIKNDRIEIIMKILQWEYIREYMISDITVISKVPYKGKTGSVHFGDAENKYWERGVGYTGKINPIVTIDGLLGKNDKYCSGILYGLEDVDYVYQLIMFLQS